MAPALCEAGFAACANASCEALPSVETRIASFFEDSIGSLYGCSLHTNPGKSLSIDFGLRQMRSTFEFLSVGFILLVLALNVYPYQGHHKIGILLIVAFLLLAGSVLTVFAQMDRDPVLSRLSDSKPNQLDRNFIWRAVSFTALPLLTLLASLVPQLGSFLSSWIQPTLQALK